MSTLKSGMGFSGLVDGFAFLAGGRHRAIRLPASAPFHARGRVTWLVSAKGLALVEIHEMHEVAAFGAGCGEPPGW
ncbi:hypothetical protein [Cupriavidus sp. SW-Y-13]|uniref:hypothetical protein n=1 Tax=Cupriavidus sp. SW-Y-13 TaxID=2653854 RepID=UPI0013660491|nr:hypothetical protein [Cupriavidus sp. SW-Y-13]